ncbi:hypothetical protein TSTA_003190 [Talaromyces stipitatus ATCC 10500]|uniref:Uncharacterized protein n=1 Tax=Talaromyces stipitatus (strain ATCC 10500 / CBS 375.48 / QM 6759 / NRRL 1006) TaxID=441959 RepID=B8MT54_TALSN|nr:uncharacterized protein TSTA_003190 [Talaromyces stipitatus ATCC 10500]EED12257.1 hypothetical protein TSTA_003190 [Talaromyces stipitatus ATCC 10500]
MFARAMALGARAWKSSFEIQPYGISVAATAEDYVVGVTFAKSSKAIILP